MSRQQSNNHLQKNNSDSIHGFAYFFPYSHYVYLKLNISSYLSFLMFWSSKTKKDLLKKSEALSAFCIVYFRCAPESQGFREEGLCKDFLE